MTVYSDIADLPEDRRIATIAAYAAAGHIVGFIVDDDAAADRYVRKLADCGVRIIDRKPFSVGHTVMVRVGPRES